MPVPGQLSPLPRRVGDGRRLPLEINPRQQFLPRLKPVFASRWSHKDNANSGLKSAVKHSFRDVRELITAVREDTASGSLWTSYAYDALKQITQVVDDKSNTTTIAYDNLGRRLCINNPDTGLTSSVYDLASNLTQKITANLKANSQAINYSYDFNRLNAITYPAFPGNNVSYTYGVPGAAGNTAGRLTKVVSHTTVNSAGTLQDSEERQYGKLGETVYEKKTVVTGTDPLHPSVFETRFNFETFGRLLRLTLKGLDTVPAKPKKTESQGPNEAPPFDCQRTGRPDILTPLNPLRGRPMPDTNRQQVAHQLIDKLPDNATWDDMMRELYEHQAIERGLADSDANRVTDNKAIRARYGLPE